MSHGNCKFDEQTMVISSNSTYMPDAKGIGHEYFTQMQRNRSKIAQYDEETGVEETYGQLLQRCVRTAIQMRSRGIGPGDIVSICAPNSLDNYVPFIATHFLGAVVASLDPTIGLQETTHMVKLVQPKMIFVGQESEQMIENAVKDCQIQTIIVVIGDSDKFATFKEFQEETETEKHFLPHKVDDLKTTCVIVFSSGTTGPSKGICINHYSFFYNGHQLFTSGCDVDRILTFATTYWVSTLTLISAMLGFGKCRCIVKTFDPKKLWQQMGKAGVTFVFLAPIAAIKLLKEGRPDGIDITTLRQVLVAGGPLSVGDNLALRKLVPGTHVMTGYGQSECGGIVSMFCPNDRKQIEWMYEKPGSSGTLMSDFQCKVVDPETEKTVGLKCVGEFRYKCSSMMNGYYNMDSTDAYDANGFLRSGDVGYFDEDLCLFVVDRIKEMMKYHSFHVSATSIEAVLNSHPKVHSSSVIGMPHAVDGDHPMGLVILQPGQVVEESELVEYVNAKVDDRHQLRAGVRILDAFPYTPSGKVKKNLLRQMILSGTL